MQPHAVATDLKASTGKTPLLFTPGAIGPVIRKNRVVMAPMTTADTPFLDDAAQVRALADVPVIAVGRLHRDAPPTAGRPRINAQGCERQAGTVVSGM